MGYHARMSHSETSSERQLSIIVPVLNEGATAEACLKQLDAWRCYAEVIVVDGGSVDDTAELAGLHADQLVSSERGRAVQQNAGAAAAAGDHLLFLHADTQLQIEPGRFLDALGDTPDWGFFEVALNGSDWRFRIIEWFMCRRSRMSSVATGDQCLFVKRSVFNELGGFSEIPLMEDIDMSKRLRATGRPLVMTPPVLTSSRRWERNGVLRTVWLMWSLRLRYWLGASPLDLAKRYEQG